MKAFFALMFISFSALAQNSSPVLDPNKYTVCAITINSDDEKKVFQSQVAKHSSKFNPVVELTDLGGKDWFKKSCESGIKCDQLVISGHFAGDFFSEDEDSDKKLTLKEMEEASCNKSCDGILKNPLEVFLFGCNTLSNKNEDSRTPAQYLQVLLRDGIPLARAEMVVESRYGNVGDSHKGSMQRVFSGDKKQIYGFDSIGPSGRNVKGFLNNYFAQISAPKRLELIESKRLMEKVDLTNKVLATSLKSTAFTQCPSVDGDDPITKNLCALQDKKLSIEKKLDLIHGLLGQENYLSYLPAINNFFKDNNPDFFNEAQKKELALISENQVIKGQLQGLIDITKSLGLKSEWLSFARNLGFITAKEQEAVMQAAIIKTFETKMTDDMSNIICSLESKAIQNIKITYDDIKNKNFGSAEVNAFSCLGIRDDKITSQVQRQIQLAKSKDTKIDLLNYLVYDSGAQEVDKATLNSARSILAMPLEEDYSIAVELFANFAPEDAPFRQRLGTLIVSKSEEAKQTAIYAHKTMGSTDSKTVGQILGILKSTKDEYTAGSAVNFITESKVNSSEMIKGIEEGLKNPHLSSRDRDSLNQYLNSLKK